MCTKNLDDMIYSSWDMERDGLKLAILDNFLALLLFTPLKTRKIKILKKWKKSLEKLSFYTSAP